MVYTALNGPTRKMSEGDLARHLGVLHESRSAIGSECQRYPQYNEFNLLVEAGSKSLSKLNTDKFLSLYGVFDFDQEDVARYSLTQIILLPT